MEDVDDVVFKGVIAIDPPANDMEAFEFVAELEELINQGFTFKPTTFEAFQNFKLAQELGDASKAEDLDNQTISC